LGVPSASQHSARTRTFGEPKQHTSAPFRVFFRATRRENIGHELVVGQDVEVTGVPVSGARSTYLGRGPVHSRVSTCVGSIALAVRVAYGEYGNRLQVDIRIVARGLCQTGQHLCHVWAGPLGQLPLRRSPSGLRRFWEVHIRPEHEVSDLFPASHTSQERKTCQ